MQMRRMRDRPSPGLRRRLLLLALAAWLLPADARAAEVAASDASAVRSVIEAQLQAFAADDAQRAFSYASAAIRSQFGDAESFMAMVQRAYPMVIRPAAISFFQPQPGNGSVWQMVQLRNRDGRLWRATYQLQQQPDAGWRINGCAVVADAGRSST